MSTVDGTYIHTTTDKNSRGDNERWLVIDHQIWMSNDDQELNDIRRAVIGKAKGCCFVGGLGLGLVVHECLKQPEVTHVTVVEINPKVIALVQPEFDNNTRVDILLGDASKFFGDRQYDWMYWDIWPEIDHQARLTMLQCFNNGLSHLKDDGCLEAWCKPILMNGVKFESGTVKRFYV